MAKYIKVKKEPKNMQKPYKHVILTGRRRTANPPKDNNQNENNWKNYSCNVSNRDSTLYLL